MRIGVPSEIKIHEYRVALTPAGVRELKLHGHEVLIQRGAGEGSGIKDSEFAEQGAIVLAEAEDVWSDSDIVVKVKEPLAEEYKYLRPGLVVFTFLHLAASRNLTDALVKAGVTAIGYETVELSDRTLPLLKPMSEVAGRMATQVGAHLLEKHAGGRGILMGGTVGTRRARVVVLGAGSAGTAAASVALGMGAETILLDKDINRLYAAEGRFGRAVITLVSSDLEVSRQVIEADIVIGAVLVAGARTAVLVSDAVVAQMKPGSVIVDVSIDQGGCFESSRPTTHSDPTYWVGQAMFYCVTNIPGAVPVTSTWALSNATFPYLLELADKGLAIAIRENVALRNGVNVIAGHVVHQGVALSHGMEFKRLDDVVT